jgi:hypothetical protein
VRHLQGIIFFDSPVRDQEVDGSNPFAPTILLNHWQLHSPLELGSLRSNTGFNRPFCRGQFRTDGSVAGCCPQAGMPNPRLHQVAGHAIFLRY